MDTFDAVRVRPSHPVVFVGRDRELRDLDTLVSESRMVTVTGIGGVGKTALAAELGRTIADRFPDGVFFADLGPARDAAMVDVAVADSAGVRDRTARLVRDSLVDHFARRRALLILDNCEHVPTAAAEVAATLLSAAPDLRVVVTSRTAPLSTPGERCYQVQPMAVPDLAAPIGDLVATESVRMFVDRALWCDPAFQVTPTNRVEVARLVRRLDGLPLAIALAAARLRTLTVRQLVERLDRAFLVLTDNGRVVAPHQRTLEAVIDWSYGLCSPEERLVWQRCSVFVGGFDGDAAARVCTGPDLRAADLPGIVDSLTRKSILGVERRGGRPRYRLLETMRQFGVDRLAENGATDTVLAKHLAHFDDLTTRAAEVKFGPHEVQWFERIEADLPNLRAAMHRSNVSGPDAALGLGVALRLALMGMWCYRGPVHEGYRWLRRLLDAAPSAPVELRAQAWAAACWLALSAGDHASARTAMARCRDLAVTHPVVTFAEGLYRMSIDGDPAGIATIAEARAELRRRGMIDLENQIGMFHDLGCVLTGDLTTASRTSRAALHDASSAGAAWATAWSRWTVGLVELQRDNVDVAIALFRESLSDLRALNDRWDAAWATPPVAWALARLDDRAQVVRAARLLGVAKTLRSASGADIGPFVEIHAEAERRCLRVLGPGVYRAEFEAGAALDLAAGQALALGEDPVVIDVWRRRQVTGREREVAVLVAEGLSNREIGERLSIGVRTVETHVAKVLPKLGLLRRTQLAKWLADNG